MSRKTQRKTSLRDHAWGGVLGLIFVAFVATWFLGGRIAGAGGSTICEKPLSPLPGGTEITAAGFAAEDSSLTQVINFLYAGDRARADDTFYGPVHSFMHNADPVVRASNPEAAKALCQTVIQLENHLAAGTEVENITVGQDTTAVQTALRDAAVALGLPRPGESP